MKNKYLEFLEQFFLSLKKRIEKIKQHLYQSKEIKFLSGVMYCSSCGKQHIDEGEFATRLHHTHRCVNDSAGLGCGFEWTEEEYKFGIEKTENRISDAIEEINSIINEQVHRLHGCPYGEVEIEDLQGVINILQGKG